MMKRKSTKRALLLSALSLLMCVSMLAGSTFAWFTDSVTSGKNQIVAGNLDIDVLCANAPDGTYTTIENEDDIFVATAGATKGLWEPGHTEVAYLKVVNNGTLALKYQFLVEPINEVIGKNAQNEDIKLSEILLFAATEPSATAPVAYTRETAQAAAADSAQKLLTYSVVDQVLEPGQTVYIALVVYMPESIGNEANYRGDAIPTINFAVTAVATQATKESDSFGNTYDKDAVYPVINVAPAGGTAATEIAAPNTGISVTVPAGAPQGDYTVRVDNKHTETDAQGETTVSFELELLKDGVEVEPQPGVKYPVNTYIGTNMEVSAVFHKGIAVAGWTYNDETGILSFETDSFSPFTVVFEKSKTIKAATWEEVVTLAAEGADIVLKNDISGATTINLNGGSIDGNGHTMTFTASGSGSVVLNPTGGTIKNVKLVDPNANMFDNKYAIGSNQYASSTLTQDLYIENVDISCFKFAVDVNANGHSVYVKDGEIANWIQVVNAEMTTFEGCHLYADAAAQLTFNQPNSKQAIYFLMGNTTFTDCHFEEDVNIYLDSARYNGTVCYNNSTYGNNGVENRPIDSFGFIQYWFPATGVYGYAGTFGDTKPAQTHFNWYINGELVWDASAI